MSEQRAHVLQMENITMQFGGVVAVNNLSLEVNQGEIVALIGPNGAGKTTAFNVITGVYQPTNGQVSFHEKPYIRNHPQGKMKKNYKGENPLLYTHEHKLALPSNDPGYAAAKQAEKVRDHYAFSSHVMAPTPDYITKMGIARTFQNIRLWKSMTVFDNVLVAKHMRAKQNVFSSTFRTSRKEEIRMREETEVLLREQDLWQHRDDLSTSLPYGLQRRLEIARALATDPKVVIMCEPTRGVDVNGKVEIYRIINYLLERRKAVILVSSEIPEVLGMSDRVAVLYKGRIVQEMENTNVTQEEIMFYATGGHERG